MQESSSLNSHPEAASIPSRNKASISLTNVAIQPFATFRANKPSIPSPIRRKPLPIASSTTQGRAVSIDHSHAERLERHTPRSFSVDNPPPLSGVPTLDELLTPPLSGEEWVPRDLDR
jgi:hypothetical protein